MPAVLRGCGTREFGGIYWEADVGHLDNAWILDPPIKINPSAIGITPVGVKAVQRRDVWHALDIVGARFYPYVTDFIEEAFRHGISRRIPSSFPFHRLSLQSRLLLIHPAAWIDNWPDFRDGWPSCVKREHATNQSGPCNLLWWHDVNGTDHDGLRTTQSGIRYPASGGIPGWREHAIFSSVPLSRFSVIRDPMRPGTAVHITDALSREVPVDVIVQDA